MITDDSYPIVNVPALAGACFRWRVRACCEDGFSPYSIYQCHSSRNDHSIAARTKTNHHATSKKVNVDSNSLKVFPNPSTGRFNIVLNFESSEVVNIRVMDSTGKLVYALGEQSVDAGELMKEWTPNSNLSNGLYILEIGIGDHMIQEKLILQH